MNKILPVEFPILPKQNIQPVKAEKEKAAIQSTASAKQDRTKAKEPQPKIQKVKTEGTLRLYQPFKTTVQKPVKLGQFIDIKI
ncbi:MAG: hypothetical protein ACE5IR_17085 [bacterium]